MKHRGLVPYPHVANVNRSVEFYRKLGFEIANAHPSDSPTPIWTRCSILFTYPWENFPSTIPTATA